jgi:methylase of polypeptide subunit release factors
MWAEEFLKEHHFEVRGKSADSHDKNESAKSQDKSERANGQDRSDSAKYQNHNVSSDYNVSSNFHANLNDNKDCNKIRILDAACGSGAIAAAMANKFPKAEVYACDLSQKALEISAKNFRISNCHNAKAFECDLLSDGAVQMILRHIFNEGHIRHEGHEKHERNEGHEKHERNEGHEGHEKHERNEGHEGQEGQEGQEAHEGFDNNLNLENYIDNVERASTSLTDKPGLDMIISNPPYVTNRERSQMRPNVLDYEPAEALFVPDEDPLLFYKALERLARELLAPGGAIFMEINEQLPEETAALFNEPFFSDVEVRKDFNDKPRMIKALKSSRL